MLAAKMMHAVITIPLDYTITFKLIPQTRYVEAWSSILHFSATGGKYVSQRDLPQL